MKKLLFLLMMVLATGTALGQNWTKDTQKEFLKTKEVALEVDLSDATIMGVNVERFPMYYAKKFEKDEDLANMVLEQFTNNFKMAFFSTVAKKRIEAKDAVFKVVYKFQDISEKAGFRGYFYVEKNGDKSANIPFIQKDGRWNDFETLCDENIEKFFKTSVLESFDQAYQNQNSPYSRTLYKYE